MRRSSFAVGILGALLLLQLALPASSWAHATLERTTPTADEIAKVAPRSIELRYSEGISVAYGGVKVYAPDGSRVDSGEAKAHGRTVTIPLRTLPAQGTYAVSWRVVSADAHPIQGAFVFSNGRVSDGDAAAKAADASAVSRPLQIAFGAARGLLLFGVTIAIGALFFGLVLRRPARVEGALVAIGLVLAAAGAAAGFVTDAALAGGFGIAEALRWEVVQHEAGAVYGRASIIRLLLVALCALAFVLLRRRPEQAARQRVALLVGLALGGSLSISGHALVSSLKWVRIPADMAHAMAAVIWFGGLLALALTLRREPDAATLARTARRYSRAALASVVALVATGIYASVAEIGLSWEALSSTTYGRLVVAKSLLLIGVAPLALANRRRHVPALDAAASDHAAARARLRRFVIGEIAVVVAVLGLTAWLIETPPARTAVQPRIEDREFRIDGGLAQVVLDPAGTSRSEAHIYVFDESNRPDGTVEDAQIVGSNKAAGIEDLPIKLLPSGPGHFQTKSALFPQPGAWRLHVTIRRGEFDQIDHEVTIPIRRTGS